MTEGYWLLLLMIVPVIAGIIVYIKFHEINWWESLAGLAISFLLCFITFKVSSYSTTHDTETLSGRIVKVEHTPEWHARWTERETYTTTDSKGKRHTKTRTVTKNRHYSPAWKANTTVGEINITEGYYNQIKNKHGEKSVLGYRPHFNRGDRYDYYSEVKDDPEFCDYPVTVLNSWENKLKESDSIVNLKKISKGQAQKLNLYEYPENDHFSSSRLINTNINIWNWDKMNAALGQRKSVNLIMVKCPSLDYAKNLQCYWKNGKKNDLVLCYGELQGGKPSWSYVFGWSKSELIKQNLATILLDNQINDGIVSIVKNEVDKNFPPHDWSNYEELKAPVSTWAIAIAFILMAVSQILCFFGFHSNNINKQYGKLRKGFRRTRKVYN